MYSRSDCSGLNGLKYGGAAEVARALSWTGSKLKFHRSKHSIQHKEERVQSNVYQIVGVVEVSNIIHDVDQ